MCISWESEEIDEALLERSATDVRGASALVRLTLPLAWEMVDDQRDENRGHQGHEGRDQDEGEAHHLLQRIRRGAPSSASATAIQFTFIEFLFHGKNSSVSLKCPSRGQLCGQCHLVAPNERVVKSLHQELEGQKRTALVRCVVPPLPGLSWGTLLVLVLVLVLVLFLKFRFRSIAFVLSLLFWF